MSNEVIWADLRTKGTERHRARLYVLLLCAVLGMLASQVPSPSSVVKFVVGGFVPGAESAAGQIENLLLMVAGVAVWIMICWTGIAVLISLISAIAPAAVAQRANRLLTHFTPRSARRVLVTAVGVGALAGLAACAPTPSGETSSRDAGAVAAEMTTTSVGASEWDLDWPLPGGAAQTPQSVTDGSPSDLPTPELSPSEASQIGTGSTAVELTSPIGSSNPNATSSQSSAQVSISGASGPSISTGSIPTQTSGSTPIGEPASPVPATGAVSSEGTSTHPDPSTGGNVGGNGSEDATTAEEGATGLETPDPETTDSVTSDSKTSDSETSAMNLDWPLTTTDGAANSDLPAGPEIAPAPIGLSSITVQPGDTLWSIAQAQLPPDSSTIDIDTAWRAWYLTNQDLIGADPNQILVGWELSPPPS